MLVVLVKCIFINVILCDVIMSAAYCDAALFELQQDLSKFVL